MRSDHLVGVGKVRTVEYVALRSTETGCTGKKRAIVLKDQDRPTFAENRKVTEIRTVEPDVGEPAFIIGTDRIEEVRFFTKPSQSVTHLSTAVSSLRQANDAHTRVIEQTKLQLSEQRPAGSIPLR